VKERRVRVLVEITVMKEGQGKKSQRRYGGSPARITAAGEGMGSGTCCWRRVNVPSWRLTSVSAALAVVGPRAPAAADGAHGPSR